jgi:hypothetical protein
MPPVSRDPGDQFLLVVFQHTRRLTQDGGARIGGPANWDEFTQWQWMTIKDKPNPYRSEGGSGKIGTRVSWPDLFRPSTSLFAQN